METKEYRTIDKTDWLRGEWDTEPDKAQFTDEKTGLPCLIVRALSGALCGYVGVPEGHPYFGKNFYDVYDITQELEVHGGLTFSDFCAHSPDESRGICHVPAPGEPDRVWWLGFDCAHGGDAIPAYHHKIKDYMNIYRSFAYVKRQCEKLAQQIAEAA